MQALVIDGTVIQVEEASFPVHPDFEWIAVLGAQTVSPGWTYANGGFAAPPAPPAPTLAQQAQVALGAGLAIVSATTPALDGTFAVDPTAQAHIIAEITAILLNGNFADGTSSVEWLDVAGGLHTFTVAQFKNFAAAVAAYVANAMKVLLGQSTSLPSATATIP